MTSFATDEKPESTVRSRTHDSSRDIQDFVTVRKVPSGMFNMKHYALYALHYMLIESMSINLQSAVISG